MTPSQQASLTAAPQPKPESRFALRRWFTPTTVVVFVFTVITVVGQTMVLGSMNQIYKQVGTLTDFTGSCVMNEYTNKKPNNVPASTEPAPVAAPAPVVPAAKPAAKPAPAPAVKPAGGGTTSPAPNRLFDIGDIINKK